MQTDALEVFGRYTPVLIAAVVVLTLAASQAILVLSDRVSRTAGRTGWWWLGISSLTLGLTIWSIDLLRQLSLQPVERYSISPGLWAAGAALAVLASACWLAIHRLRQPFPVRLSAAMVLAAPAFAAMHRLVRATTGSPAAVASFAELASGLLFTAAAAGALFALAARFTSAADARPWLAGFSALVSLGALGAGVYLEMRFPGARADAGPLPGEVVANRESVVAWAVVLLVALVAVTLAAHLDRRVRNQHEENLALRRSEDRFRSLIQASAQIVWTTAPDGQMRGEQSSWREFTGQAMESYAGAGWFNAIHPEDRESTARLWEETMGSRTSAEFEHRLRRHDGEYRRCVVRVVPVIDRDGSVREWVGTHTDVSERSRVQDERDLLSEVGKVLSSSLDYTETLAMVGRLLVPRMATWYAVDLISNDEGALERVAAVNHDSRVAELLGRLNLGDGPEAEQIVARRVVDGGESVLLRRTSEDILDAISSGPEHRAALEGVGLTSLLWVPLSSRGQVLGVMTLASARDGRTYDLRDLALAEELARRSANAVDNARLYARAKEAILARDEVLGMVSHDLRNPISTIGMTSELLLDLPLEPAEQRKHLEIIRRTVKGMNRFIQDLLDVSQTETGQLAIDTRPVPPEELVVEACDLMRPLIAAESQRLECDIATNLPPVEADPTRVQQVLSNLLGNSLKFAGEGGVIRIEVKRTHHGVRFAVMDNGPGIAREALPRLFDRHWRARETAHLGAGLGLAIAKGIVEAHGGRIWVESEVGHGTAFFFVIPAAPPQSATAADKAEDREHQRL